MPLNQTEYEEILDNAANESERKMLKHALSKRVNLGRKAPIFPPLFEDGALLREPTEEEQNHYLIREKLNKIGFFDKKKTS